MEPLLGKNNCEKCLKLDPNYIKAYERKARCHMMMKEIPKAIQSYESGLKVDSESQACKDGLRQAQIAAMGYGETKEQR